MMKVNFVQHKAGRVHFQSPTHQIGLTNGPASAFIRSKGPWCGALLGAAWPSPGNGSYMMRLAAVCWWLCNLSL